MMRRRSRAVAAVLAVVVACILSPSNAEAYTSSQRLVITGHGSGHGHGMSQYGARGAAIRGLNYKQILGFYYPHTAWSSKTGQVRVLLAEVTTNTLVVKSRPNLIAFWRDHTARWNLGALQPSADAWQIVPAGGGASTLMYHVASGWKTFTTQVGELDFYASGGPISVSVPGGWRSYRGTLGAALPSSTATTRWIVNTLPLDQYILGVIPAEMPASWPTQALRAQAVATRTYAAYEMTTPATSGYDLFDDTRSQVYGGYAAEQTSTSAAAGATSGQVLTYGGQPAFTEFASSNGGYELAALTSPVAYLPSQRDPYERYSSNPNAIWWVTVPMSTVLAKVRSKCGGSWTTITRMTAEHYPPTTSDPWLSRIHIYGNGTGGVCTYYGYEFRVDFGLKSSNFGFNVY